MQSHTLPCSGAFRQDPAFDIHPGFEVDLVVPPAKLSEAVDTGNEEAIWALYRETPDPDLFHNWLDAFASRIVYEQPHPKEKHRGLRWHACLFMVPLILPPGFQALINEGAAYRDAAVFIQSRLQDWFGAAGHVRLFASPVGYDSICAWSPAVMQRKLQQLTLLTNGDAQVEPVDTYQLLMPPEAPTLAFLVGALERPLGWPEIPVRSGEDDLQLQHSLSARLQLCAPKSCPAPRVGLPSFFSEAAKQGLDSWFEALDQGLGILGWDVTLAHEDMVICQLRLDDAATHTRPIPIRGFHMGPYGHAAALHQLARIAPRNGMANAGQPA